jgi:hypothetical protein
MSRLFINLRRVLFGVSCTIVFGFGATEAFARPEVRGAEDECPLNMVNCCGTCIHKMQFCSFC